MIESASPSSEALAGLLRRHESRGCLRHIDAAGFDTFAGAGGEVLALLSDDPARNPESWDMAVVLPELLGALPARVAAAALLPADSRAIAARYGVTRYPALLFLRDGAYLGVLEGMFDWQMLAPAAARLLAGPATRAPGIGVPLNAAPGGCH